MSRPSPQAKPRRPWVPALAAFCAFAALASAGFSPAFADGPAPQSPPAGDSRDALILELRGRVQALEAAVERLSTAAPADPTPELAGPPEAPPAAPAVGAVVAAPAAAPVANAAAAAILDEALAERALERTLVRTGALLLPTGTLDLEPSFTYVRQERPLAGPIVDAAGAPIAAQTGLTRNEAALDLTLRAGLPWRSQVDIGVSYAYADQTIDGVTPAGALVEIDSDDQRFGDVRLGLSHTLLREQGWRPDLIGRIGWDTASAGREDGAVGFGAGFNEIQLSLTAIKRQDPLVFVVSGGVTETLEEDDIKPGAVYGLGGDVLLAASPDTSLRFGVSGAFVDETEINGRAIPGSDQQPVSFRFGVASVLGQSVFADVAVSVGLTEDAPDFGLSISTPLRMQGLFRRGGR